MSDARSEPSHPRPRPISRRDWSEANPATKPQQLLYFKRLSRPKAIDYKWYFGDGRKVLLEIVSKCSKIKLATKHLRCQKQMMRWWFQRTILQSETLNWTETHISTSLYVITFIGKLLHQPLSLLFHFFSHENVRINLWMFDHVFSPLGILWVPVIVLAAVLGTIDHLSIH